MKIFKNLKIGDKIYVGVYAEFIYNIKLKNGYIGIQTNNIRNKWLYIPYNHINSNKVKLKNGLWIHLSKRAYKKFMYKLINNEIEK